MGVHIEMLRNYDALGETFRRHGWRLDKPGASSYSAVHNDVVDQVTARQQLHALGLLTSSALRIRFGLPAQTHNARGGLFARRSNTQRSM
jgi:hypothetical protein